MLVEFFLEQFINVIVKMKQLFMVFLGYMWLEYFPIAIGSTTHYIAACFINVILISVTFNGSKL